MTTEPSASSQENRFSDLIAIIQRRWATVLVAVVVGSGIGVLATALEGPVYASSTLIEIEGRSKDFSSQVYSGGISDITLPNPTDDLPTQVEVLMSGAVFENAVQRAGIQSVKRSPDGGALDPLVRSKQVGQTNVIQLTAESSDKQVAQLVANAMPNAYRDYVQQKLSAQLDSGILFVRSDLEQKQRDLKTAQDALEKFRVSHKLTNSDQENQTRLAHVQMAENDVRAAEQRVNSTKDYYLTMLHERSLLKPTIDQPGSNPTDREIELEKQKIADLEGQLAAKSAIYTDESQEVRSLQAQLDKERAYLKSMPKKFNSTTAGVRNPLLDTYDEKVADAKGQYEGAIAANQAAVSALSAARQELSEYNNLKGEYDSKTLAVTTATQNLDRINTELQSLLLRQSKAKSPVTTIQPASNAEQIKPRGLVNLLVGLLVGLALGLGFAALRERFDDRLYTPASLLESSGLPALGNVSLGGSLLPALITDDPSLAQNDNYRMLRSSLLNTASGEPYRTIAVTSALADEGRSETAVNLAGSMAMGGHQVVLIDANFRSPALAKMMNVPEGPGLAELLRREATPRDVSRSTSIDGLHVIAAGKNDAVSSELLGSEAFAALIEDLKERYHFVVIDTSPCLAGADGPVTAAPCDATIYVVKVGTSRRTATKYCTDQLRRTRANLIGLVTNRPGANPRMEFRDYADA